MPKVYVCGHKNPDTDSICSAIAYSELKKIVEGIDAVPVRLGPLNRETRFVLNYFGVPEPIFVEDVYTQVSDISFDKPLLFKENTSMFEAWNEMIKEGVGTAAVVDNSGKLLGITTIGELAKAYLYSAQELSKYKISVDNLIKTLNGESLTRFTDYIEGKIIVAAMSLKNVLKRIEKGCTLIVGDRRDVQRSAILSGVNVIIVTGNNDVDEEIVELAQEKRVTIIKVAPDTFDTVKLLNQSISLSCIMKKDNIISFKISDYIDDVKEVIIRKRYRNFPVLDDDGKILGFLGRRHILDHERKKVILVDHNEFSQSVEGIQQARILEIIDHHRLGIIETDQPILFRNHPVGSTCTIVNKIYEEHGITPTSQIAGILCSAIISDTLLFKSPTCTMEDIRAAKKLAEIAGIDIETFANEMFKEGTSLEGKSIEEIFYTDFKEFKVKKYRIGIGQISTLSDISAIKKELLKYMEEVKERKEYLLVLLMVTNIIKEWSEILFVGSKDILQRAFNITIEGNSFYLPGAVSRKKQILPPIVKALEE